MQKKILFITTSHQHLGNTGRQTGVWTEEIAIPYFTFIDAGYQVDIASPKGGAVPFDPNSIKPIGQNHPTLERFLTDPMAQQKVQQTLRVEHMDVATYDAVFFPGGHGAMWDLPEDAGVTRAVERAFVANKIIGGVCHGVAGLVSAKTPAGHPIVSGRRINSFTNEEENAAGLSEVVPFLLETRLRELGGCFEKASNWVSFAVQDGLLITGQNPASSIRVAELILHSLSTANSQAA